MADRGQEPERGWEVGWEGHTLAQRQRLARLPLTAKLEWLEEAQRLVERMRPGSAPPGGSAPGPEGTPA